LFLSSGYTSVPDSYKYGSDDAATGQMLAPDNYVQYALRPSGYNRYLYANGNPLKYTDPSGDLSHAEWNQAMSLIENTVGTGGGNGGYISSGMGSPYIFKSMDEAFGYGVGYISDHGWWGGTAPGSAGQALANYSARTRGSGRVTAGMWNGYMSAQWSGYAYDINTMNASSVKLGNGFQTTGLTYAHANLGGFVTTFYSYSKAEALFLGQQNGGTPYYEDPLFYLNSALGGAGVGLAVKGEMWKTNELWHIQKNGKVRYAWDPKRNNHFIKQSRLNSLNKTAGLRNFSNKVAYASLAVTGYNIISTGEINPSDMLNATMAGISFTGVGSLISGTYFIVDFGFTIFTGEGLGQRLDRAVGSSVQLW
ncbi:hypothetical protein, partial [Niabella aquatica]